VSAPPWNFLRGSRFCVCLGTPAIECIGAAWLGGGGFLLGRDGLPTEQGLEGHACAALSPASSIRPDFLHLWRVLLLLWLHSLFDTFTLPLSPPSFLVPPRTLVGEGHVEALRVYGPDGNTAIVTLKDSAPGGARQCKVGGWVG